LPEDPTVIPGFLFKPSAESAPARTGPRGQGLVEYALIIVLIAVGVVIAITAFGTPLKTVFDTVVNNLRTAS
jgi:pilus assembly protein Flp/PilA